MIRREPGPAAVLLLAAAACAAAYLPRIGAPLVWDDLSVIVHNAALDRPARWRDYASEEYFRLSTEATWRPLATLGTRAAAAAGGRRPAAHRLPWLLLHLAAGLALAALARSLGLCAAASAWAAALFLLHPAHAETLMCASFNEDVLAGAALAAMLLAHRRRLTPLAAAAFAAALLSKENGALGLPLAALMDAALGERPRRGAYAAYAAALAAYLALRFGPMAGPAAASSLAASIPWGERLALAAQAWLVSARILLVPARLRIEYFAVPPGSRLEAAAWLAGAAASGAALLWAARRLRRRPGGAGPAHAAALGLLWPALALAAVSPLVPANVLNLRLTAERFLYLPSMGAALAAAWALRRRPALRWGLAAAFAVLSAVRAADWADATRLWSGLARIYPWSSKAHEGLGDAWLASGRPAEAAAEYEAALGVRRRREDLVLARYVPLARELAWESPGLERRLGCALLELGEDAAAGGHLRRAIELAPASELLAYRALAYLSARGGDFREARRVAGEGLARWPEDGLLRRLAEDAASGRLTVRVRFY